MSQLDALQLSETLRNRLVDFSRDQNFVRPPGVGDRCRELWSGPPQDGGLVSHLWVEASFPASRSEHTLDSLVASGRFPAGLRDHLGANGTVPSDRPLYAHQAECILAARTPGPGGERPALLVTAGTGAGKTEAFLLPVLDDLSTHPRVPGRTGVRSLVLYPMNALVNDQVDRLYEWLRGQSTVSLFHFTSETPEDRAAAARLGLDPWDACRFRTRRQARGLETAAGQKVDLATQPRGPVPDIVITNYSMLEYMLCRPQDAPLFGPALRSIVLDEAHLYTGTLAAEITLLLRRLLHRCGLESRDVLQIATSATIGSGQREELEAFVSGLFSKPLPLVRLIEGSTERPALGDRRPPEQAPTARDIAEGGGLDTSTIEVVTLPPDEKSGDSRRQRVRRFTTSPEHCDGLAARLSGWVDATVVAQARAQAQDHPACFLHHVLGRAPLVHRLVDLLYQEPRMELRALARKLFPNAGSDDEAIRATTGLLQLTAAARLAVEDYPLVPHRIHLLARPADGLVACLDGACPGAGPRPLPGLGALTAGQSDRCPACRAATLGVVRCGTCGEVMLAGTLDGGTLRPARASDAGRPVTIDPDEPPGDARSGILLLVPEGKGETIVLDPRTAEVCGAGAPGVELVQVGACPNCARSCSDSSALRDFVTNTALTESIVTETALMELPELASPETPWLPAKGRRMLTFSDSRQEAAHLGPRLTRQHQLQVFRAALVRCVLDGTVVDEAVLQDLREQHATLERDLAGDGLTPAQRRHKERKRDELEREMREALVGGTIESWSDAVARQPLIHEILDPETSTGHQAWKWSQQAWESNARAVRDHVPLMLMGELVRPRRVDGVSLESLGLLEITYPGLDALEAPAEALGLLATGASRNRLEQAWGALLAFLCDDLRTSGCCTLGDDDNDAILSTGGAPLGRWCSLDRSFGPWLQAFRGATPRHNRRRFVQRVLERAGVAAPEAERLAPEMLAVVFSQLHAHEDLAWIERSDRQFEGGVTQGLRLKVEQLCLRPCAQVHRCVRTGLLWPRSALGCAPLVGCDALEEVDPATLDDDPRVGPRRREFKGDVFSQGLWAEEHSAQLSPRENRRLQDLFRAGVRNVLSSTTTMELGIDIGGLSAVLLGNVPPGKASYLQRAGRAGRRTDGSSIVLTFVRPRPYDREVFNRFGDFLAKPFRSPRIFLDRDRVVQRHVQAFLLGAFFRDVYPPETHVGAMNAFGYMGRFCGVALPERWRDGLKPALPVPAPDWVIPPLTPWRNPFRTDASLDGPFVDFLTWMRDHGEAKMRPALERLLEGARLQGALGSWREFIDAMRLAFEACMATWRRDYQSLLDTWKAINDTTPRARAHANALRYQMLALHETTVIESLADRQFLPRYGFPIGVQKLRVLVPDEKHPGRTREEDQFRLERAGILAIREYVPGSELMVGGKVVASRGLLKHWTGARLDTHLGLRGQYAQCTQGHFFYRVSGDLGDCPVCGEEPLGAVHDLLLTRHGFTTAASEPPRFGADVERVGQAQRATVTFAKAASESDGFLEVRDFAEVAGLTALYREDGELLVYNRGECDLGFAICLECGYADSEESLGERALHLPSGFAAHTPIHEPKRERRCRSREDGAYLRNQTLAAKETTDIAMLDFSACLPFTPDLRAIVTTLAHALQIAGARVLQLDTRELGVMTTPAGPRGSSLGAVIYDNVPGGAGHVRELLDTGRLWLETAREVLFVSTGHDDTCETACLSCLLTFDAQDAMARGELRRRLALGWLDAMLGSAEGVGASPPVDASPPPQGSPPPEAPGPVDASPPPDPSPPSRSNADRIAAGRARMQRRTP